MRAPPRRTPTLPIGIALLALAGGASGAACYSPSIEDGTLECARGDRCPRGFACDVSVNLCFRPRADGGMVDGSQDVPPDAAPEHDAPPDVASDRRDAPPGLAPDSGDAPPDPAWIPEDREFKQQAERLLVTLKQKR